MRFLSAVFTLSLFSPALPAQTAALAHAAPAPGNCPVGLSARRWSEGGLRAVQKGSPAAEGRALFLRFTLPEVGVVREATVVVHGSDNQNRILPAATKGSHLTETFQLRPEDGSGSLLRAQVTLKTIRNVEWVELAGLRYDDGTLWQEASTDSCRVAPDGFLPVMASNR